MQIRTIITLAIAVFIGLIAVFMVRAYIGRTPAAGAAAPASGGTPVVVAAAPIARGAVLEPALLKVVHFPGTAPAGAFTDTAQLIGSGPTARVALRAMVADEPVLAPRVSTPGGKANLSGVLASGMRAISVRSNEVAGVGGFVLPGDRVDVLVTRQIDQTNAVTNVLAQNVRVLGVDQSDDLEADKPVVAKAVTVEVSPDEAAAISLAQNVGSVTLSLRQLSDDAPLARKSMSVSELGGAPRVAGSSAPARRRPATPAAPSGAQIQVTRGVATENYTVAHQ
ncbi:MAG: Flp pilus assembly protein CpaB [Caulobacterales bacterium 68-7]|nr:MAG: Flp pilus assembly protein CpaB [Caulobacterales bacterium 68-7]